MIDLGRRDYARWALLVTLAAAGPLPCPAQSPIVQPGAPGQPAKELSAEQAIEMSALVAERTNRPELVDVAGRIDASQAVS